MLSATGANVFLKTFKKGKKNSHFKKHGGDYPGITADDYQETALELLQKAVGGNIHGYMTEKGIVRYDEITNDFAAGHPVDGIFTMMKLDGGIERYKYLKNRDEANI